MCHYDTNHDLDLDKNKNALEKIQYLFNFKNTDTLKMKDLKGIEYLTKLEIIALKI